MKESLVSYLPERPFRERIIASLRALYRGMAVEIQEMEYNYKSH